METVSVCSRVPGVVVAFRLQPLLRYCRPCVPSIVQPSRGLQAGLPNRRSRNRQVFIKDNSALYRNPSTSIVRPRLQSSDAGSQGSPVRTVPVQVAHELLNAGHRYIDVRTSEEYAAGHIEGAVNIPYMYKGASGMTKNLNFIDDVGAQFGQDDELVVGCQMGKRSHMAATDLVAEGFTGVTDMAGGYLAWVQSGKPTKVV